MLVVTGKMVVTPFKYHFSWFSDQSQTLPAAFDKSDKDAFIADCKEVIIIIIINIISKFFQVSKNLLLPDRILGI